MSQNSPTFSEFVVQTPLTVFAGAMGTELQRRGYKTKLPLWSASANIDAPELVTQIHADYFDAGADVCITNTFRTTPWTFKKLGRETEAHNALKKAVDAAKVAQKTQNRRTYIGGSIAPLEDCYEPDLVPSDEDLTSEHQKLAEWLAAEGVDFLLPETVNALREARIMAKASSSTGLPFIISFVVDSNANLLDGTPIDVAVKETDFPGRIGISLNCRPIDVIDAAFDKLTSVYDGPIGLYPNGFGKPHDDLGWAFEENTDSVGRFVNTALQWNAAGAKIIGGCCGTTPEYIRALADARNTLTQNKQRA
jgi:S-methylmethionine-dependent homocysteine/selenocysteine methylase